MKKLAIIITHPIQYYVPIFRLLSKNCILKVFYTWGPAGIKAKHDPGFGKIIEWDMPLLEGYNYELLENIAKEPGSHHGKGIINPDIIPRLNEFAPDTILVYGYSYHSHFKVMRHFKGKIPIWFRGDSTLLDENSGLKALLKQIYLRWVYSYADKAFYVGTQNHAYFKQYGLKEHQLIFAPHAIDNERFSEDRTQESFALRERLGIANNDTLILFAGKLEPKKNPALLLEAFISLNKEQKTDEMIQNLHLLFIGNGVLEKDLKLHADQFNQHFPSTQRSIHFIDFQNQTQMPLAYQACDIFCLPSQGPGETWGLAVNEAMAAGKAIIVSDKVGCAKDLVKANSNGYIFKSGDKQDLVEKILLMIASKEKMITMGQNSSKLIQDWSFKKIADTLSEQLSLIP
ncbi:glycosyltransferase family 4 protein [Nubsella zeaxanthinifaciens]|uniref:glycosyltransferase family 4 protein n=1 Tax=Nubsella zeaxanthinifaciens TaxID=392412 RepID=UPI003D00A720